MSEPLSEHELAGWRAAVRNVQLKSTKVDVSKMSDAERFLATIDALTTQLAEMTRERNEWMEVAGNYATALVSAEEELEVTSEHLVDRALAAEATVDRYKVALERIAGEPGLGLRDCSFIAFHVLTLATPIEEQR